MGKDILTDKISNDEAIEIIYNKYFKILVYYSLSYTHRYDVAEDIVQDIIVNFFLKRRVEDIHTSLISYLKGAVIKASIKYNRDNNKFIFNDLEHCSSEDTISFINEDEDNISTSRLMASIDKLSDKNREIVRMIIFSDKKHQQVADELSLSLDSVKYRYYRSLDRIRDVLKTTYIFFF